MACCRRMSAICGPVDPGGMVGEMPGLAGGMNGIALIVLYTAGVMVRKRRPRAPSPKCD